MLQTIHNRQFDFLVAGSGFSGSVMAMGLANSGFSVCMAERGEHPRFAIGESSTPIADMILRDLAGRYNLPFLHELSRYGTWKRCHPNITCGLKRGFSYYRHSPGKAFTGNRKHSHELLVAASMNDENSDTHWLRSDVDQFLVEKALRAGVAYSDKTLIKQITRREEGWLVEAEKEGIPCRLTAGWIIDATGSPEFSGKFFGTRSSSEGFQTHSTAVFSHFTHAGMWEEYLLRNQFYTEDYPFNPDHSALHHIIDEGWIWMLRFTNQLLSAGLVIDEQTHPGLGDGDPGKVWQTVLSMYPSLESVFKASVPAPVPGKIIRSGRLQRRLNRTFGRGWAALGHTAGFVDPLHSTGIAQSLTGVEKLLTIFTAKTAQDKILKQLQSVEVSLFNELAFIDLLVSMCYKSRWNSDLFAASAMLYFAASIRYEQSRLNGTIPNTFLCAGEPEMRELIEQTHRDVMTLQPGSSSGQEIKNLIQTIRERIAPFNNADLLDPLKHNMYTHTAVAL